MTEERKPRGLAAVSLKKRNEIARKGGLAYHGKRGLQAASEDTRKRVAALGGKAPGARRGRKKKETKLNIKKDVLGNEKQIREKNVTQ